MMKCKDCSHRVTIEELEMAENTMFFPNDTQEQTDRHLNCECMNENGCCCDFKEED